MIDNDTLADARARVAPDAAIFDAAVEAVQSMPDAPRALVEHILGMAGMGKGPEHALAVLPHDDQRWALLYLRGASTCALVRERGLEAAGIDAPFALGPYARRIGSALSAEIGLAQRHGAWQDARTWTPGGTLPDIGDGVVIGLPGPGTPGVWSKGPGYGGAHIFTALTVDCENGAYFLHSVDGGQGAPADIAIRTRSVVEVRGQLWTGQVGAGLDPADMRPAKGRRVLGWIRTSKLPLRAHADTDPAPPMGDSVSATYPYNAGPPYTLAPLVKSKTFDLGQATAAVIVAKDPTGADKTLAATLGTPTQDAGGTWSLQVTHALAAGDINVAGTWRAIARITLAGIDTIETDSWSFIVRPAF